MARHLDLFLFAIRNMRQRRLRSWLTVFGIVIGIGAIVALIAIAQGLTNGINKELEMFGKDEIIVTPGSLKQLQSGGGGGQLSPTSGKLFENDAQRLEKVPGIRLSTNVIMQRPTIEFRGQNLSANIMGVEPEAFTDVTTIEIEQGRWLAPGDRGTVVFGAKIANDIFRSPIVLNSVVLINGKKFRAVGLIKRTGNTFDDTDTSVYLPYEDAKDMFGSVLLPNEINYIYMKTKPGFEAKDVAEDISLELRSAHKVGEGNEDFTLITSDFINEQVGNITSLLTVFLGGIAGISLLVGGVGVANAMFMAVMERTQQIGVLKAIGATRNDILESFILEAALIGMVGGVLGVALGAGVSLLVGAFGIAAEVSVELALFAMAFALGVGGIAGFIPARRAADLPPVEALRYE
jgi:putative ABC transport system permease protein